MKPDLRVRMIDRLIYAAEKGGVKPVICVNKVDLLSADQRTELETTLAPYGEIDIRVIYCSAETGEGLEQLSTLLKGRLTAVSGHSGVGKSSILNRLLPDTKIRTNTTGKSAGRVREAVVEGLIPKSRYESYLKLSGAEGMQRAGNPDERKQREEGKFTCLHCGKTVSLKAHGTEHRNHCPHCLWSLHVDDLPGDDCEGRLLSLAMKPLMKPPFALERLELRQEY